MKGSTGMTGTEQLSAASGDYQATIRVKASPDALFGALTTVSGLAAWWNPATGSGETGGELRFIMNAPEPLVIHVDEAIRPTSVRWTVTDCPFLPDWVGTRPTFTITPLDGDTSELHFRHARTERGTGVHRHVHAELEPLHDEPARLPRGRPRKPVREPGRQSSPRGAINSIHIGRSRQAGCAGQHRDHRALGAWLDIIASGDTVATRWVLSGSQQREFMGIPPPARRSRSRA